MLHAEALDLIQRAGGQVTFIVQRFVFFSQKRFVLKDDNYDDR